MTTQTLPTNPNRPNGLGVVYTVSPGTPFVFPQVTMPQLPTPSISLVDSKAVNTLQLAAKGWSFTAGGGLLVGIGLLILVFGQSGGIVRDIAKGG